MLSITYLVKNHIGQIQSHVENIFVDIVVVKCILKYNNTQSKTLLNSIYICINIWYNVYMRNKKDKVIPIEALTEAKAIVEEFDNFTSGIRVLQLIQRKADGGNSSNTKLKSVIVKDSKEYTLELAKLIHKKKISNENLRIYAAVNDRVFTKAIRHFKQTQLDADYGGIEATEGFYYNIHNKFISALMQPSNKKSSYFLLDLDQQDNNDVLEKIANLDVYIIKMYTTKQGWHIITTPFNPALFESANCSIHKDGMLLLSY